MSSAWSSGPRPVRVRFPLGEKHLGSGISSGQSQELKSSSRLWKTHATPALSRDRGGRGRVWPVPFTSGTALPGGSTSRDANVGTVASPHSPSSQVLPHFLLQLELTLVLVTRHYPLFSRGCLGHRTAVQLPPRGASQDTCVACPESQPRISEMQTRAHGH